MSAPAGRKAARRALDRARELLAAENADAAIRAVAEALAHDPGWARAHALAGQLALKTGDPAAAETGFRAALGCDEADHAAWCGLAAALQAQGRGGEVAALLAGPVDAALAGDAPWGPPTARLALLWLDHAGSGPAADAVLARLVASAPHLHEAQLAALTARLPAGGEAAAVLSELLTREGLRAGSVTAVIRALRDRLDHGLLRAIGDRLLKCVAAAERDMAAVGAADLIDGAVAAVAVLRTRARGRAAWTARQIRQVASVLRRAGEASLAARWLRIARRSLPADAGLDEDWLRCCADCGLAGEALDWLASGAGLALPRRVIIEAELLTRNGQREAALALLEAEAVRQGAAFAVRERLDLALGLGRLDTALACRAALLAEAAGTRLAAQFSVTLPGFLLTDLRLCAAEPLPDARRFFAPAAAAAAALPGPSGGGGTPAIALSVAQYWDDDTVPDEVAALAASWASASGGRHHLFTRPEAQKAIFDSLGPASADAFGAAFHGGERADFLLLCRLLSHGGIVADPASRRHGPLAGLIGGGAGLVAAVGRRGELATAVIAARPGHPAIALAHDRARRGLAARSRLASWLKTGPGMLTMEVAAWADSLAGLGEAPDLRLLSDQQMARIAQTGLPLACRLSAARREALDTGEGGHEKTDARAFETALAPAGVNLAG